MKYRWSFAIFWGCMAVGFVMLLCQVLIGALVAFAGIVQALIFYRCPHCHAGLLWRGWPPNYCPNCGEELFN